jgi:hypothetical protein
MHFHSASAMTLDPAPALVALDRHSDASAYVQGRLYSVILPAAYAPCTSPA